MRYLLLTLLLLGCDAKTVWMPEVNQYVLESCQITKDYYVDKDVVVAYHIVVRCENFTGDLDLVVSYHTGNDIVMHKGLRNQYRSAVGKAGRFDFLIEDGYVKKSRVSPRFIFR